MLKIVPPKRRGGGDVIALMLPGAKRFCSTCSHRKSRASGEWFS
jgi:hypothetical protein